MADFTKQIFEMLGVEPEEEFRLWYYNSDMNKRTFVETFMLTANLNLCYFDTKIECDGFPHLHGILNNTFKIIKIFHPTAEEKIALDYAKACGFKEMTNFDVFKGNLSKAGAEDLIIKTKCPYRCRYCNYKSLFGCKNQPRSVTMDPRICRLGIRDWLWSERENAAEKY